LILKIAIMKQVQINILLLSALLVGVSSCLKKDAMNIDPNSGTRNLVEFANTGDNVAAATSFYPRFATDMGVVALGGAYKFNVNVSYSGADNIAPEDITVNLALDTAALTQFNNENGTTYTVPPGSVINFPASLVITQGSHMVQGQITVNVNTDYNFGANYAVPLKITQASYGTVSANFGKAVYSFTARNKYDGIYLMEATAPMLDVINAGLSGWYPNNIELRTYTDKSVVMYDPVYSKTYGHCIQNGGSGSYYGSFSPVFFFDNSGNVSSTTNYYGQQSGGSLRSCVLNTGTNKITFNADGSVKYIEVNYIMAQGAAYTPRTYFYEKFTYVRAR
jgi:hypothetical protein